MNISKELMFSMRSQGKTKKALSEATRHTSKTIKAAIDSPKTSVFGTLVDIADELGLEFQLKRRKRR